MSSRRMLYPYTLTAKVLNFPYKHYWDNSWAFKFHLIAVVCSIPFFWKMTNLVNSPTNVKKFEEMKRKEHEAHLKHLEHLM